MKQTPTILYVTFIPKFIVNIFIDLITAKYYSRIFVFDQLIFDFNKPSWSFTFTFTTSNKDYISFFPKKKAPKNPFKKKFT